MQASHEHATVAAWLASRRRCRVSPGLGHIGLKGDHFGCVLKRALAWLGRHGVTVERVMTDNGSAYRSKLFAKALAEAGARHVRTKPYTPRTNGKAERFIQTTLREWAYAKPYRSSAERTQTIEPWTDTYNLHRPHSGIKGLTPWQRVNNLLGNDI
jgi:transposase InsO family protein